MKRYTIETVLHPTGRFVLASEVVEEINRLRTIETAVRVLFTGTAKFMVDGDRTQWDAYDLLVAEFSVIAPISQEPET